MPQSRTPEGELVNVVKTWLDAEAGGDSDTLRSIIADDFIGTAPGGNIVGKADIVPEQGSRESHFPRTSLGETTTRLFGDAGVVMGRARSEDPNHAGEFRFTIVCMKRQQGWQMVAAHLAPVPAGQH